MNKYSAVNELKPKIEIPDFKCFLIGLNRNLKDEAYNDHFQPEGITTFNFRR